MTSDTAAHTELRRQAEQIVARPHFDPAVREWAKVTLVLLSELATAREKPSARLAAELTVRLEDAEAGLATARQELATAYEVQAALRAAVDEFESETEAELVVVRRQLAALREFYEAWWAVEQGVTDFDLHADAVERLRAAHAGARAVLDAGQKQEHPDGCDCLICDPDPPELTENADDRWHNQIGCWCEQRSEP